MDATALTDTVDKAEFVMVTVDEYADDVVTVELDRPERRNALNAQLRRELKETLHAIEADNSYKGVIITGSEESATFGAGGDVREIRDRSMLEQREALKRPRVYETIDELSIPVIARLTGYALGGGCELALGADIRVAHADTTLGLPEINIGIVPGGGGTQRLPRLVGEGQAMRLILTGETIDATEAHDIGLVDFCCETTEELDARVERLAKGISEKSTIALETAKKAVHASSRMGVDEGLEYEAELFSMLFATGEKNEGVSAFLEDRDPEWEH